MAYLDERKMPTLLNEIEIIFKNRFDDVETVLESRKLVEQLIVYLFFTSVLVI